MDDRSDLVTALPEDAGEPADGDEAFEFLYPASELVTGLAEWEGTVVNESVGLALKVTEVKLDLPVEIDVDVVETAAGSDRLRVLASPPTQQFETTIMPVFHRLRVRVEANNGREPALEPRTVP